MTRIKSLITDKGFMTTLLLSVTCLIYFYGKLLEHPNEVYFTEDGDGLQSYYSAIYHVKHDTTFWKMNGMNYPYGEQVFFTGSQPFITNSIKLISKAVDISDYTVGIINLTMLFSIVLCALCIYFIFKSLKLPFFYSAFTATAIAFLSPQLDRLSGHFSLTYQFAIPLLFLFLLKFYHSPSLKKSLLISILTFFMSGTQFYFFGFFIIIQLWFWLMVFVVNEKNLRLLNFIVKHFFIQVIAPFILIQAIVSLIDPVTDRTQFPWGYLAYTSNLTGVFFPPNARFYTPLFEYFIKPEFKEWEGHAFIGLVSVIFFIVILLRGLKCLLKGNFRLALKPTDNEVLNTFLWAGITSLLMAFGLPFIIKDCNGWLHYAGPLKQLRAIGRFTWPFYYIINIISFYLLFKWLKTKTATTKYALCGLALFFIGYDAFIKSDKRQYQLNHRIIELLDSENKLPDNQWLNTIKQGKYQAIISLPYFHIGSENIMIATESDIIKYAFMTSIKTGLPLIPIMLSRTSLSQTYKNIQLVKEPYRPLEIIDDFKNTKPFLVLACDNELNDDEKRFLSKCKKIKQTPKFNVYEISVDTLRHITNNLYDDAKKKLMDTKMYRVDSFLSSDSLKTFVYNGYEEIKCATNYTGKGSYTGKLLNHNSLYMGTIPLWKDQEYVLSFWVNHFTTDLYPRSTVELAFYDSLGVAYHAEYFNFSNHVCVLDGTWALIEKNFRLRKASDKLSVIVWNESVVSDSKMLQVDELFIRPLNSILIKDTTHQIILNNRTYVDN